MYGNRFLKVALTPVAYLMAGLVLVVWGIEIAVNYMQDRIAEMQDYSWRS